MTPARISPYRWLVLAVFMVNVAVTQFIWLTFAPVSRDAAALYTHGNVGSIDILSVLFMVIMIPLTIPSAWCIERFGLKWGVGIGVFLMNVGGALRIASDSYWWVFACTTACALGQPFILNSFTKVSSNWFPTKEEVLSSGMLTMSLFVGLVIAMFTPDLILTPYRASGTVKDGIHALLALYAYIAVIGVVLFFAFVKDKPKTPPNAIAAEKKMSMSEGLKAVFRNRDFLLLLGSFFVGLGAFNAIMTKIDAIFEGRNVGLDPNLVPGLMGGLLVVGGIFGAVIISALSDKYRKRKLFLAISMGMCIPTMLLIQYSSSLAALAFSSFAFGFFLVSAMPVGLVYAVEKTHPVPEPVSNGLLMLSGQITGILFVVFFSMPMLTALFGAALIFIAMMNEIQ
jgi:MFS family permease